MERIDRCKGSLLGLAVGDAMGAPLEFSPPGSFKPITDMTGSGYFHLQPAGLYFTDTKQWVVLRT